MLEIQIYPYYNTIVVGLQIFTVLLYHIKFKMATQQYDQFLESESICLNNLHLGKTK